MTFVVYCLPGDDDAQYLPAFLTQSTFKQFHTMFHFKPSSSSYQQKQWQLGFPRLRKYEHPLRCLVPLMRRLPL